MGRPKKNREIIVEFAGLNGVQKAKCVEKDGKYLINFPQVEHQYLLSEIDSKIKSSENKLREELDVIIAKAEISIQEQFNRINLKERTEKNKKDIEELDKRLARDKRHALINKLIKGFVGLFFIITGFVILAVITSIDLGIEKSIGLGIMAFFSLVGGMIMWSEAIHD